MHIPQSLAETLGWLTFEFSKIQPLLPTYAHLIFSALFPIFAGAHASLSRPSSAAKPAKRRTKDGKRIRNDETQHQMEGLTASDAVMFPLAAGAVLTSLYFIIKWLENPALLNKILNAYFATFSVFSVAKLVSDGLDVFHSVLFPHEYAYSGQLWKIKPATRTAEAQGSPNIRPTTNPLPGPFSRLPLPDWMSSIAWFLYLLPNKKLTFGIRIHQLGRLDCKLGIHGLEGALAGLVAVAYYNLVDKPWWLTNLLGFGFAYGAVQLMSPTTFWTGTLLLGALFLYDIYFVFFTPMMVTVAKSLDVPIKLLFPRPSAPDEVKPQLSMLGLGDVVLPGLMIGLALRFDLYMHYVKLQRIITRSSEDDRSSMIKHENEITKNSKASSDSKHEATPEKKSEVFKVSYVPIVKPWGSLLWTSPFARLLDPASFIAKPRTPTTNCHIFGKPYFYTGLTGYVVGLLATLVAMHFSHHPQPALLYLVPGVVGSLWLTALLRGELRYMWEFSDAFDDGTEDKNKSAKTDSTNMKKQGGDNKETASSSAPTNNKKESVQVTSSNIDAKEGNESRAPRFQKKKDEHRPVKLVELVLLAPTALVYDAQGNLIADGQVDESALNSLQDDKDEDTAEHNDSDKHNENDKGKPEEHVDKRPRMR